ncbi:MAG: hypothetical protein WAM30_08195 [Candidatus Dormiibacterota bacterium]
MWIAYVLAVVAGLFAGNGVPHFVKGITGKRHRTPFRNPSSAVLNVVWGWCNLLIAFWLLIWASTFHPLFGLAGSLFLAGALAVGIALALAWQNDPRSRGEEPATGQER